MGTPLEGEELIQQAQPLPFVEEPMIESLLTKFCSNDHNFQNMYRYLDSTDGDDDDDNNLVYMIEMVKYQDESLYQEYVNGLTENILPNMNDDAVDIVFRMKNPIITPETHFWDEIIILQYPKKMYDRLYGFGNTDYATMKTLLEKRSKSLQQSSVWAASLNQ